jgi:hypothetical protein
MLIISDETRIGNALSGLPFIYHMAAAEARMGRPLYLMFRNREVLSLVPRDILERLTVTETLQDVYAVVPRIADQRIAHLCVYRCRTRYGHRYHAMYAHFVNHGVYLDRWEAPRLEFDVGNGTPAFDFIVSPYSCSDSKSDKLWPYERWQQLIDRLRKRFTICVVGAGDEPRVFDGVNYSFDQPLRVVCGLMSRVRHGVLSIDNGISHLAHSLRVPHLLLYPILNSLAWTCNLNPNAYRLIGYPLEVSLAQVWRALEPLLLESSVWSAHGDGGLTS